MSDKLLELHGKAIANMQAEIQRLEALLEDRDEKIKQLCFVRDGLFQQANNDKEALRTLAGQLAKFKDCVAVRREVYNRILTCVGAELTMYPTTDGQYKTDTENLKTEFLKASEVE